ncbi:MAG: 23S rRNA (guanine(2445)-N(2))-methyltransferase [uncultured Truepera sp.]|uniref:23S rRNA (Guanine(2445)-N(2))-methyltransferase n=1 Tax=uncultured Truepera sp. TaxID=543023 RepID=A0A6J4VX10_9DEIN|nr:MAG: 23S rRNA (guanine(2445)-N(2))-methyltransferase [uncultured Truepera sp.]
MSAADTRHHSGNLEGLASTAQNRVEGVDVLTPRALERRLKRYVYRATHDFLAVGAPGFEAVLLGEVRELPNVTEAKVVRGGVEFRGPLETIYHANLRLSTAHRVLWRVAEFLAQSYPMLFNKAQKVAWERVLGFTETVRFSVSSRGSRLHHQPKIAQTIFSAAVAALSPLGLHPRVSDDAVLNVHVRLFQDRCTLSLDTSGEHLHRRGYRTHVGDAPLRETLAAAILKTVGYKTFDLIVDPMCGSGTFLLEAARGLRGVPPGAQRSFAFEQFPSFQEAVWNRLKWGAEARIHAANTTLLGFDLDPHTLTAARRNAERAGVADAVRFDTADALTLPYTSIRAGRNALLVCNPPYGRRLGDVNAHRLYAELSAALRSSPGWTFAILAPEPAWLELPTSARLEFQNGGLRVALLLGQT